jgi:NTE family protein
VDLINKDLILKEIPLFASLSEDERSLIKDRGSFREYRKGDIIYKEGSPPDAFYCIILGRAIIYTLDRHGNETLLECLHRGKYFGIISLLTGEPHSVTAKAINDCLVLVIDKENFNFILERIPRLAINLSQTLSRRLKRKDIHQKTIFESTIISVFSSYSQTGKTIYALNLALSLRQETRKAVLIIDILPQGKTHSLPRRLEIEGDYRAMDLCVCQPLPPLSVKDFILKNRFGIDLVCIFYQEGDDSCMGKAVDVLNLLVNDYHYIILDLPSSMDPSVFRMLNQSDLINILTSPETVDLERTHNLIARLRRDFGFEEAKINVIINEYKFSKLSYEQQSEILKSRIWATLPKISLSSCDRQVLEEPASEYSRAVRRVSRELGERFVGLALGVGVAYGFCHIGVLKVIEEEKIPIDVISGSSIGALIASLWATGRSSQEILQIAQEFKEPGFIWGMMDFTFPWAGFIKGGKLYNLIKKYLGNKTFYDVKLPLKIIASDVKRKESRVLDKGPLVDAIMASCAMPGVFIPFRLKEELLFDGGIVSPLPTEPLFKMGVKKIVAVNVTPSREDMLRQYEKFKEQLVLLPQAIKKRKWYSIKEYFRQRFRTNILDYIFSSIEILQSEVAKKEAQLADIVLHPDLEGLFWLELHRAEEFARRGEEEARRHLDRIRQIIDE